MFAFIQNRLTPSGVGIRSKSTYTQEEQGLGPRGGEGRVAEELKNDHYGRQRLHAAVFVIVVVVVVCVWCRVCVRADSAYMLWCGL